VWWGSFNAMMRCLLFIWGDYFMCILSVEKLSGEVQTDVMSLHFHCRSCNKHWCFVV